MPKDKYKQLIEPKLFLVEAMARNGATLKEIAENLGVCQNTLNKYKKIYPELEKALSRTKLEVNLLVENALLKKAIGYTVTEEIPQKLKSIDYVDGKRKEEERIETVTVQKVVPSDTTALKFWLERKSPDEWNDKTTKQEEVSIKLIHNVPRAKEFYGDKD